MIFRRTTFAAIAALTCLLLTNDVMAQRGGWGGGGRLEFLNNSEVQKELDLVEEQIDDLDDIGSEAREIMRDAFSGNQGRTVIERDGFDFRHVVF